MIVKKIFDAGKTPYVKRLRALITYIGRPETEDNLEKCIHFQGLNFTSKRQEVRALEMEGLLFGKQAFGAEELSAPLTHWMLSWNETEMPTPAQADKAVTIFLQEMGYSDHQVIYGLHANTDNLHVHLAISRYDPVTHRISKQFNDIYRAHRAMALIEHEGNWLPNPNALYIVNDVGEIQRNPDHSWKRKNFAFASPSPLFLEFPPSRKKKPPDVPGYQPATVKNDDRVWYLADDEVEAHFVWDHGRLWALDWADKQRTELLLHLAQANQAQVVMQRSLASFMSDMARKQSISCVITGKDPMPPLPKISPLASATKNIDDVFKKLWTARTAAGEERSRAECYAAMALRAIGYTRRQVLSCLALHGRDHDAGYATRVTAWAFGARGDIALLRRGFALDLWAAENAAAPKRKAGSPRLVRIDPLGHILVNGKPYLKAARVQDVIRAEKKKNLYRLDTVVRLKSLPLRRAKFLTWDTSPSSHEFR